MAAFSTAAAVELDTIFSKKCMTQKSDSIPWERFSCVPGQKGILPVDSGVSSSTIISGDDAGDGISRSFVTTLFNAIFVSRTGKFILIGFFVSDGVLGSDVTDGSSGRDIFVGRGKLRTELSVSEGFPGTIDPLILEDDPDWLIPGIGFDELVMVNIGTVCVGVIT